ncbi:MAG: MFS transporter [Acidimicrobiales bacterium]|jgi:ABC-type branched-subunit amino acid transport system ATPase component/MFS family permease|tara:strand:- start:2340 stop:4613 length:2274 start_codon:yes stop_codon:yes gene_type:complete
MADDGREEEEPVIADDGAPVEPVPDETASSGVTALAATVLDEEAARQAEHQSSEVLFADDLLPGVKSEGISLKKGLAMGGGAATFVVLMILNSLDELQTAAIAVLAPDIRDTFGVSDGTITFIASSSGAFVVLGAIPMGWAADRMRRVPIIGWASIIFAAMVTLSGMAVNAFSFFWARFGVGIAKANTIPVHSSMIADTYPIGIRGRIGAIDKGTGRLIAVISPILVGGIAAIANGPGEVDGWRWTYYILGIPVAIAAIAAFFLKEPQRGRWEKEDVLGESFTEDDPLPVSMDAAFSRLMRIKTVKSVVVGFSALGFGLFTAPVLENLWLEDKFGLESFERGAWATAAGLFTVLSLVYVGPKFDRLWRENPTRTLHMIGALIGFSAVFKPIQWAMPTVPLFIAFSIPTLVMLNTAFAMVSPVMQAIVPYRLRGSGTALITLYIFFIGGTGGGLISFMFADSWGPRVTTLVLTIPSAILGGLIMYRGAKHVRHDLSLNVQELFDEQDEQRRTSGDDEIPALQLNNIDFSYGPVQVLFDVAFEVKKGETLALLGTNGAGKSTILRVISGLGIPERGVVRLGGRTVTYTSPQLRSRLGIQQLPGGKGVFPDMTVRQNLVMGAYIHRRDSVDVERRIASVLELFPDLERRQGQRANSMSGGQQQMLALARVLLHEPEILLIDELSLGLAPTVVQDLLELIERLQERGQTIILVEQSLNVALSIADRAIFLEKGQIRFEGSAQELLERDDLARAVFLGRDGG